MEKHSLMGGKLHVYKRAGSSHWQCSTFLAGENWRVSTRSDSLQLAKEFADDWYFGLRGKERAGLLNRGHTFAEAAAQFLREYPVITEGRRSPKHVENYTLKLNAYLLPFFEGLSVAEITPGKVQEYRVHRAENGRYGKPPSRQTILHEIVVIRQVLKTAYRHGWLQFVPDLSEPYKTTRRVSHRAWFSPTEYRQLYEATRKRAKHPLKEQWRRECEDLHDYVLFMANTGLRPDEAKRLQDRDATIVFDQATNEHVIKLEVRGKRGFGYCTSTPYAVRPLRRLRKRNKPEPTDLLFPRKQHTLFNRILDELGLKFDRDGNRRAPYSLRHTYICMRLMDGADIYNIAKNCRTSVEIIQAHYAAHIKDFIDTAAVNTRKSGSWSRHRRKKSLRKPKSVL